MVSKIIKRTPTKSIKNRGISLAISAIAGRNFLLKIQPSVVVASINKFLYTCHRRFIKLFMKFTRVATPKEISFTDDLADGKPKKLIEFLGGCNEVEDMRDVVKVYLAEEEKYTSVEI